MMMTVQHASSRVMQGLQKKPELSQPSWLQAGLAQQCHTPRAQDCLMCQQHNNQ
jgi:hypothetical protein